MSMKFVIVIPDGCADQPQTALDGLTPLQAAKLPAMDSVAERGRVGGANHTPAHLPAGSAVANMSLLGYDPQTHFTGRAPLEAAAQGIEMGPDDWAIRCNLVTIVDQIMKDFTADHITSEEARELLDFASNQLEDQSLEFIPGVSYRNLMLLRGQAPFSKETRCTPPPRPDRSSRDGSFPPWTRQSTPIGHHEPKRQLVCQPSSQPKTNRFGPIGRYKPMALGIGAATPA